VNHQRKDNSDCALFWRPKRRRPLAAAQAAQCGQHYAGKRVRGKTAGRFPAQGTAPTADVLGLAV